MKRGRAVKAWTLEETKRRLNIWGKTLKKKLDN